MKVLILAILVSASAAAQTTCSDATINCSSVPRLVRFSGVLTDTTGVPRTGVTGITFSIYSQSSGGSPLWQETQNVTLDSQGRYAVLLGMTNPEGLPLDIFNSPESKWLGVWPQFESEQEHTRIPLVSVPYAFKAKDAETLQGLPASAFLRAPSTPESLAGSPSSTSYIGTPSPTSASGKAAMAGLTESPVTTPGGTVNAIPKFDSPTSITTSQITDINGMVSMQNLANILFADKFPGGVPDAINACPTAGCIIYAVSPYTNLNLGSFDPGPKAVTLYLGPYHYSVGQITLESNLRIIGMGGGITYLQSTDGTKPVFVIPQSINGAAQHVFLSGFQITGAPGNTNQSALFLDASNFFNQGVWWSEFHDLMITGFGGISVYLKGTNANFGGMTQFTEFNRVIVFRPKGAGNGLRIDGAAYELYFNDCEFDGVGDGVNIFVGGRTGSTYAIPIDFNFRGLTTQNADTAVQIDGGWALSFYSPHHEFVKGVYSIADDLGLLDGVTISDAGFQTSGTNNGAGYLLNVLTPRALGVRFIHNHIMGPADVVVKAVPGASIVYQDNLYSAGAGTDLPVTNGITNQVTAASIINIGGSHSVGVNTSTTPITTIQANLGAGEMATFYAANGPITFSSGGNINLMGEKSLSVRGSITFVITDLGTTPVWTPVSQWTPSGTASQLPTRYPPVKYNPYCSTSAGCRVRGPSRKFSIDGLNYRVRAPLPD